MFTVDSGCSADLGLPLAACVVGESVIFDNVICAPPDAPQIPVPNPPPPPKPPRLDWIDERIIEVVREYEPLKLWQALNLASEEMSPRSRAEGREVRLKLWGKSGGSSDFAWSSGWGKTTWLRRSPH